MKGGTSVIRRQRSMDKSLQCLFTQSSRIMRARPARLSLAALLGTALLPAPAASNDAAQHRRGRRLPAAFQHPNRTEGIDQGVVDALASSPVEVVPNRGYRRKTP